MMIATLWVEAIREPWSPDFTAQPLSAEVVGVSAGPIANGAKLFHEKGCEYCHQISGNGGHRGPDLSFVGDRLTKDDLTIRIMNGGYNMPAYAGNLSPQDLEDLLIFLGSRRHPGIAASGGK